MYSQYVSILASILLPLISFINKTLHSYRFSIQRSFKFSILFPRTTEGFSVRRLPSLAPLLTSRLHHHLERLAGASLKVITRLQSGQGQQCHWCGSKYFDPSPGFGTNLDPGPGSRKNRIVQLKKILSKTSFFQQTKSIMALEEIFFQVGPEMGNFCPQSYTF